MKGLTCSIVALLAAAAMLQCGHAMAQARGSVQRRPAPAAEVNGERPVAPRRRDILLLQYPQRERAPPVPPDEVLDHATRATRLEELETWLRRLPGRFRIDGRIEKRGRVTIPGGGGMSTVLGGEVTGVADCAAVGSGLGLHCIFNATWPVIDKDFPPISTGGGRPTPIPTRTNSEALRSLQPAVLVLGSNPDSPEARALLVTDDSLAHSWAGRLNGDTLRARRLTDCIAAPDFRCIEPLEITAGPDGEVVTVVLRGSGVTITLTMYRDPDARPKKRMKVK